MCALHDIMAVANEVSSTNEVLANPLRVVILGIINSRNVISWTDLKTDLEKILGPINPNTLAFHLKKLIAKGYIVRMGNKEPKYRINQSIYNRLSEWERSKIEIISQKIMEMRKEE